MGSITQDVVFGVPDQALFYDVPEGRPSAVLSVVATLNTDNVNTTAVLGGTGSVEAAPDTTFDEPSGISREDPRRVALTSTTGVIFGRRYLAINGDGEREWVEVAGVGAGIVRSKHDLENDYDPGATFQTTRIVAPLDPAWLALESNLSWELDVNPRFRVRWAYTMPGDAVRVVDTYFDVLAFAARHSVTALDVEDMQPGWIDRLSRDDRETQGRAAIENAYNLVKWDLYADLVPDQAIRNRELFEQLIAARAAAEVVPSESNTTRYTKLYQTLIRSGVAPIQTSVGVIPVARRPIYER